MLKNCLRLSFLLPLFFFSACTQVAVKPAVEVDQLLSGEVLFGEVIDVSDISPDKVLAVDDEIQRYVASKVGDLPHAKSRLRRLLSGMIDDGLLSLEYDPNLTHTAMETFYSRQGNCLSFSNLFVAMAREANLEVTFQMVEIPPSFSADGELVLLNNHINILVDGVRSDTTFMQDFVVDFNTAEYNGNYETRKVSDDYAIALYYSNLAVEAMQAGDTRRAFRFLKTGIETNADIPGLWVNLGALYSNKDLYGLAEQAYHQALSIQPSNKSALVNLVSTLAYLGRQEEADYYLGRVSYYRNHNPYYHFYLGQAAYEANNYSEALSDISQAIKLKKNEHQFYFLQALTHFEMQNYKESAASFKKAKNAAKKEPLIAAYERKLQGVGDYDK